MHDPLTARWNSISLRTKITGVTVLLVTLGLLVAGFGTMTVLRSYLLAEVDSKITTQASQLRVQISTCATQGPNDYFIAVIDSDGAIECHNEQDDPPPSLKGMSADEIDGDMQQAFTLWYVNGKTQWRVVAVPGTNPINNAQVALIVGLNLNDTNRITATFLSGPVRGKWPSP